MIETGNFKSLDHKQLFYRADAPDAGATPVIVLHGFAEHSGRYGEVLNELKRSGFAPLAFDFRGHGHSDGRRGHIDDFQEYVDDLSAAVAFVKTRHKDRPVFVLAHSMGALVAINHSIQNPNVILGFVFSSPLLGIRLHVPTWKKQAGAFMSKYWPAFRIPGEIKPNELTHDTSKVEAYGADPLVFHHVTARWFEEILRVTESTVSAASQMKAPFLLQLSGDDRIVSAEKSCQWYEKCASSDKTKRVYEGFFHEIFNEIECGRPMNDFRSWLLAHQNSMGAQLNAL